MALIFLSLAIAILFLSKILGYLPFIGKTKAKNKLTAYVQAQEYKGNRLDVQYDWYNSRYTSRLNDDTLLSYRLQNNTIHDESTNGLLNEELKEAYGDIIKQFPRNLIFPKSVFLWSTVNADNYVIKAERLYLLGILNIADLPSSESHKMPANIAIDFIERMGDKYNITGIQLIYEDKNGMYDIEIRSDTFRPLEYDQLLAATKKRSEEELPENYLEWRQGIED